MKKDWTKIQKKYKGMWVALASDQMTVLGAGKTVKEALVKARVKTSKSPTLTFMPENLNPYVGSL